MCTNCTIEDSSSGWANDEQLEDLHDQTFGGVIYLSGGSATFERCTIRNSRGARGGVVSLMGGKIDFIDSNINTAAGMYGGVGSVSAGVLNFENCKIGQSTAKAEGVVFRNTGGSIQLTSSNVTIPTCSGKRGWVYGSTAASFLFSQVRLTGMEGNDCVLFKGDEASYAFAAGKCHFANTIVESLAIGALDIGRKMAVRIGSSR